MAEIIYIILSFLHYYQDKQNYCFLTLLLSHLPASQTSCTLPASAKAMRWGSVASRTLIRDSRGDSRGGKGARPQTSRPQSDLSPAATVYMDQTYQMRPHTCSGWRRAIFCSWGQLVQVSLREVAFHLILFFRFICYHFILFNAVLIIMSYFIAILYLFIQSLFTCPVSLLILEISIFQIIIL